MTDQSTLSEKDRLREIRKKQWVTLRALAGPIGPGGLTKGDTERFWSKVDRRADDECHPWMGSKSAGYGHFCTSGSNRKAHRIVYELCVGPIPNGLVIDHLCRNPSCVNPKHLEAVSAVENTMRGVRFRRERAAKANEDRNDVK